MSFDPSLGPGVVIAPINFAAAGDNIVIASKPGNSQTVVKMILIVSGDTILTYKRGATALSGPMQFSDGVSEVLDYDPIGWYTVIAGEDFIINSASAVQVSGTIYYVVGR